MEAEGAAIAKSYRQLEKLEEAGTVLYGISEAPHPIVGVCTLRLHMPSRLLRSAWSRSCVVLQKEWVDCLPEPHTYHLSPGLSLVAGYSIDIQLLLPAQPSLIQALLEWSPKQPT